MNFFFGGGILRFRKKDSRWPCTPGKVITLYRFLRWRPWRRNSTFVFKFNDGSRLRRSKSIRIQYQISMQYLNPWLYITISVLDFDIFVILFCNGYPNFTQIKPNSAELGRHIDFSRWRPCRRECTSGFEFSDSTRSSRMSKSICRSNIDEISRLIGWGIATSGFEKSGRHIGILFPAWNLVIRFQLGWQSL